MLVLDCLGDLCRLPEAVLALEKLCSLIYNSSILLLPLIFPLLSLDKEGLLILTLGDEPRDQQGRDPKPDGCLRMAELQLLDNSDDVPLLLDADLVSPTLLDYAYGVRLFH